MGFERQKLTDIFDVYLQRNSIFFILMPQVLQFLSVFSDFYSWKPKPELKSSIHNVIWPFKGIFNQTVWWILAGW